MYAEPMAFSFATHISAESSYFLGRRAWATDVSWLTSIVREAAGWCVDAERCALRRSSPAACRTFYFGVRTFRYTCGESLLAARIRVWRGAGPRDTEDSARPTSTAPPRPASFMKHE